MGIMDRECVDFWDESRLIVTQIKHAISGIEICDFLLFKKNENTT